MKHGPSRLATLLVAGLSLAAAGARAESYMAVSKTAMSITGDIQFDDSGVTFANGESLEFDDPVADHLLVDGSDVPARVYPVQDPADPLLEHGNRLCGNGDVTYVASWETDSDLTILAVFTGSEPPRSDAEMCASYSYDLTP